MAAIVGFFSLEMSSEQLATRILAEQAQIPSEKIRRGQITDTEFNTAAIRRYGIADPAAVHRPHRRYFHRPACRPRAAV